MSAKYIVVMDFAMLLLCFAVATWEGSNKPAPTSEEKPKQPVWVPRMPTKGDTVTVAEVPPLVKPRKIVSKVLVKSMPDTTPYLTYDPDMLQALYEQANYLRRKDVKAQGASGIQKVEMQHTLELLQGLNLLEPTTLLTTFDFYRVRTDLHNDRVRMTGYYTPVVRASRTQTSEHSVPILKDPVNDIPNPTAIRAGALSGRGLELAWVRSEKELKNAQLQGNCLVEFPDGTRKHLGFARSVRAHGGSYVFFKEVDNQVLGAGTFPLTAGYSVAVDLRYIPLGATLLAELPDLDSAGRLKGYTYRILFAQDRGGAILTTKRLDLYCGIGQKGLQEARKINGFGRLWVMLPK